MGERKGQNKYYPPDYDPNKGGLNKWQGTHALRERARKLHLGVLIIRFEMPFNVWCEGCGNHVGMGVRYNAEKTKVGMYYTTPLYEFKMKCHLCSNYFVIRTDPKNFDYELVSGLTRQEKRWDMTQNEQVASTEREKANKLATDAMFKLEHTEGDVAKSKAVAPHLKKLEHFQQRMKDDFSQNQALRRIFRTTEKQAKLQRNKDAALLKKSSLNIDLVAENPDDVKLASLMVQYKTVKTCEERKMENNKQLDVESIFSDRCVKKREENFANNLSSKRIRHSKFLVDQKKFEPFGEDLKLFNDTKSNNGHTGNVHSTAQGFGIVKILHKNQSIKSKVISNKNSTDAPTLCAHGGKEKNDKTFFPTVVDYEDSSSE